MVVVGAPSYLKRRDRPKRPQDLTQHACINIRLPTPPEIVARLHAARHEFRRHAVPGDRRFDRALEPDVVDLGQESPDDCVLIHAPTGDRRAQLRGRPAEEMEGVIGRAAQPVDLAGHTERVHPIVVIERHRKAQHGKLPGAEQLALRFGRILAHQSNTPRADAPSQLSREVRRGATILARE
ncbi:hypothetical protein [Bradyrhizobium sp. USDA 4452]